jgi:coenzyme F420-reducing hydrogenase delta subunit/NAD-dependent dihydropyrimidine dehydrogenase PreA subunit
VKETERSSARIIVFLTGLVKESNPVIMEEIMRHSLQLQGDAKRQTFILTKNLKVAGNGLETLYRKTKRAGAIYLKLTDTAPDIHQEKDGRVSIEFVDELTRQRSSLNPDVTVVDETISPSEYLAILADIFALDRDPAGFAQTGNVHRISTFTNRKGITVVGPSRGIQPPGDHIIDAGNAAISVVGHVDDFLPETEERAEINPARCTRCLTCYRLCPHRAVMLDTRPSIIFEACERCGICAAECPQLAIQIKGSDGSDIAKQISTIRPAPVGRSWVPFLVIFCCSRSASPAKELASAMGYKLAQHFNVIEVPCAGSISIHHIFTTFETNVDGVLVMTCHQGNCHSEKGNTYASQRVDRAVNEFETIGFEKERLRIRTIAANMGKEFATSLVEFEKMIHELGPSNLKKVR